MSMCLAPLATYPMLICECMRIYKFGFNPGFVDSDGISVIRIALCRTQ